jgi:transcriptional regulator with XRE-family HTH domain
MGQTTEIIKQLRAHKLTQTEIARLTGIPQPRISRWESGDVSRAVDDGLRLDALLKSVKAKRRKTTKKAG